MRSEEPAAVRPEPWPDLFEVGLRQLQAGQLLSTEECESAFPVRWRQRIDSALHFEQKHKPMGLSLITMLAHKSGEMKVLECKGYAQLFFGFAATAGIRRLSRIHV